jgi:hypothetical protein
MSIVGSPQWMYNPSTSFYPHEISQSCRFEDGDSPYLTKSVTHNRKTFTISFWAKRGNIKRVFAYGVYISGNEVAVIEFDDSNHNLSFYDYSSGYRMRLTTNAVLRDTAAWYHTVFAVDTTQSTASDRVKIYINGSQVTSFLHSTYPSQSLDLLFGAGNTTRIGTEGTNNREHFDGYLAEFHLIDGLQLTPSSFGQFKSGIWTPADTSGLTYGSGGVRLQFQDSSALGDDTSGNGNDFTASGLGADDQVIDSPTNNFSVLKIAGTPAESGAVLSQGNLKCESTAGTSARNMERSFTSTLLLKAGFKWYVEHYVTDTDFTFGLSPEQSGKIQHDSNNSRYCVVYNTGGAVMNFQSFTGVFGNDDNSVVVSTGDVVGMLVDMTVTPPKVTWSLNGQWGNGSAANQSNPTSFITLSSDFTSTDTDHPGDLVVWVGSIAGGQATSSILNFGQDSTFAGSISAGNNTDANSRGDFKYAVPSDALALCTANLPDPGIDPAGGESPTDYFDTILYTGDGSSSREIDGLSFQPDWIWFKQRSGSADNHRLHDVVRGNTKHLSSDEGYAEGTESNTLLSFDNDGFTIGNAGQINENSQTFVAWNWKAGGSASSNSNGSITSSVSVSQESGFSVVGYTGTGSNGTVGHGLGVVPQLIIIKCRTLDSTDWVVYHEDIGNAKALHLNSNGTGTSGSGFFNNTSPTSTVFSISTDNRVNQSASDTYIAYCFANVDGYQKIGSFKGNGNDDGPLINVGFRPAWVMVKRTDSTNNWFIFDSVRAPSNRNDAAFAFLRANLSNAEASNVKFEFNSTAFKPRDASAGFNADGGTYVYLAFAEQPFKFANAR